MKSIYLFLLSLLMLNSLNAQNSFVYKNDNQYKLLLKSFPNKQNITQKQSAFTLPTKKFTNFLGVNLVAGGPSGLTSISVDYHPIQRVSFEVGFKPALIIGPGYYGGLKYFFKDDFKKATPFIGIYRRTLKNNIFLTSQKKVINGFYFPVGIQTINANAWSFTMEIAGITSDHKDKIGLWGAIKIGYYFFYKGE
ncbi:MAG TPA: hypothetical protein EYG92_00345 [Lutibacter sp.]|nr:hypothetical protein [Lutibacter sp.]